MSNKMTENVRKIAARRRTDELQCCQRRLEYLSSRLQDLALEIGDGQGAVWLKENMWFLNKPALFFDDVLFSVGKICNHLVSYLTFHKRKLVSCFPFLSFMGILYEVGEILGSVRDLLLLNPKESLSVKRTQIDLFWQDCTPFLFVFENNNHLLLSTKQIPLYMKSLLDLVPVVIQVGLCMYCAPESQLRGFDSFAETCIRLSKALVETSEFLSQAEQKEPIIVPFLRQWILYALELVQNGVKVRTDMTISPLSPRVSEQLIEAQKEHVQGLCHIQDPNQTVPKLSLSNDSSLPDDVAESSLAPLKVRSSSLVRTSCQPFRWIDVASTHITQCRNERRKALLEEICLKENQRLISDIFVLHGTQPRSWKGVKMHCPLITSYDEVRVKLVVKVKVGERWRPEEAFYDKSFGKGHFLVFNGCMMEGFVAIEERPMISRQIGPAGGRLTTSYDTDMEAVVKSGKFNNEKLIKMMVQPTDKPRERQYRETCPDDFRLIKSTSNAIEIDGTNTSNGSVALKIPFNVLNDPHTKVLVLKYTGDTFEVSDADAGMLNKTGGTCYTINNAGDQGTVLAAVDDRSYSSGTEINIRNEMQVLLGKKHLCKLLLFVEAQQAPVVVEKINEIVLSVVCTEKYRISDVVREKSKVGLIELPKSQSPDRLLKQADEIKLEVKGSVTLDPDIPDDAYSVTYLEGSDNYVRFPVKISDFNGRVTFVLRSGNDNSVLHTFFCNVSELLALIVHEYIDSQDNDSADTAEDEVYDHHSGFDISALPKLSDNASSGSQNHIYRPQPSSTDTSGTLRSPFLHPGSDVSQSHTQHGTVSGGDKTEEEKETEDVKEVPSTPTFSRQSTSSEESTPDDQANVDQKAREASLKVLNRNSLVNLAKQIRNDECNLLGVCLGLKPERLSQIYRMYRHSNSLACFYVLYEWRGRKTHPQLADRLIHALADVGRRDLAHIVTEVRKENRGLVKEDFSSIQTKRGRKF